MKAIPGHDLRTGQHPENLCKRRHWWSRRPHIWSLVPREYAGPDAHYQCLNCPKTRHSWRQSWLLEDE